MKAKENKPENKKFSDKYFKVANGVWGMKIVFVNIYMIRADNGDWVLVDAGLKFSASAIQKMAAEIFGPDTPPKAIILTHAHFDHVGALKDLLEVWPVPVYAHQLELPYLKNLSSYPPPDPTAGGGLMSYMSFLFPNKPTDLKQEITILPYKGGDLDFLHGWRYILTPGHAPGHISLFRERDHLLIAGDAFVTTQQESLIAVATQRNIISGPPKYFTYDWVESKISVERLAALQPKIAATGHGKPMRGLKLRKELNQLADQFELIAVPLKGRYVDKPARANERGVQYVPSNPVPLTAVLLLAGITSFVAALYIVKRKK